MIRCSCGFEGEDQDDIFEHMEKMLDYDSTDRHEFGFLLRLN